MPSPVSQALQESLETYIRARRERIPHLLEESLNLRKCAGIQGRYFAHDFFRNPLNTLWAIPYMSLRKILEIFEKFGVELARTIVPQIPRAWKTDFQREVERLIQVDLFGLPLDRVSPSDLSLELGKHDALKAYVTSLECQNLLLQAETEIRKEVAAYCETQNGFTDLAASGGTLVFAQIFFGDRSLDVFTMGRRWASFWSRREAISHFVFGKKLGHIYYSFIRPPAPTTGQVWLATGIGLVLLALLSTTVSAFSYPVRGKLGLEKIQLEKLIQSIEDKLLLKFIKNARG
ncbi:MAG TPA: DUF6635 family protein [Bdellovibrionota bacterium]|jgi:hypothetical protein